MTGINTHVGNVGSAAGVAVKTRQALVNINQTKAQNLLIEEKIKQSQLDYKRAELEYKLDKEFERDKKLSERTERKQKNALAGIALEVEKATLPTKKQKAANQLELEQNLANLMPLAKKKQRADLYKGIAESTAKADEVSAPIFLKYLELAKKDPQNASQYMELAARANPEATALAGKLVGEAGGITTKKGLAVADLFIKAQVDTLKEKQFAARQEIKGKQALAIERERSRRKEISSKKDSSSQEWDSTGVPKDMRPIPGKKYTALTGGAMNKSQQKMAAQQLLRGGMKDVLEEATADPAKLNLINQAMQKINRAKDKIVSTTGVPWVDSKVEDYADIAGLTPQEVEGMHEHSAFASKVQAVFNDYTHSKFGSAQSKQEIANSKLAMPHGADAPQAFIAKARQVWEKAAYEVALEDFRQTYGTGELPEGLRSPNAFHKKTAAGIKKETASPKTTFTKDSPASGISSQDQFDELPSGSWFVNPSDGKILRKK